TLQCDANISSASKLTLQTTVTAWEASDDDGFFLLKVIQGDFSAVVHIVTPFNNIIVTSQPILLQADLSLVTFTLENGNSAGHSARLHLTGSTAGTYTISDDGVTVATV